MLSVQKKAPHGWESFCPKGRSDAKRSLYVSGWVCGAAIVLHGTTGKEDSSVGDDGGVGGGEEES